jgi:acetolactate synthase-1/2/3 large subunit
MLVELLEQYGVKHVFGVPGGQTLSLYEGILNRSEVPGSVEHVLMRDERSCAFAADAYARVSRRTGVCDATVGPGATNLVSGLGEAMASSVPLVAIVSDVRRSWSHLRHRSTATQTLDQLGAIFSPVTKGLFRIEEAGAAADVIDAAFRLANSGRPGPVVLEVPEDVFQEGVSTSLPGRRRDLDWPWVRCAPDPDAVQQASDIAASARHRVIVAGGGVLASGAEEALADVAELLDAPVVTTFSGKGALASDNPLSAGVIGLMGNREANELLGLSDCILVVGAKLGQFSTRNWELPSAGSPVIHIDVDPLTFTHAPKSVALWADAKLGLQALREAVGSRDIAESAWSPASVSAWQERAHDGGRSNSDSGSLRPQEVIEVLNDCLSPTDRLVCDASLSSGWGATLYETRTSGRYFLTPRGLAGLGWGLPAAIGASLAADTSRVVCLAGDGAWGYSMNEVETLARVGLPLLALILNNGILAWSQHGQLKRLGGRTISTEFAKSNYALAAEALGARGLCVRSRTELRAAVRDWDRHPVPTVLDIPADPSETPVISA